MAVFDQATQDKLDAVRMASGVLDRMRAAYGAARGAQEAVLLYNAGTNPAFNAAMNALYTNAQLVEFGVIGQRFNTLLVDGDANHASLIQGS